MDTFFEKYSESSEGGLYNTLAVLYDYIYEKHYDYDVQFNVVKENVKDSTSILEGACGTGRLIQRLQDEFETVIGIDLNNGVLDIARERNPTVNFYQDDITNLSITESVDCYCVLGNALVHLNGSTEFQNFTNEAFDVLSEEGCLIFDYMEKDEMIHGYSESATFEDENYKVERNIITTKESEYIYYMSFAFDILQKHSEKTIKTGDTHLGRVYDKSYIRQKLRQTGFSKIRFKDGSKFGPEISDTLVIAKV